MNYNPKEHHRRSIRLKEYDYTNPNWYYLTICTHDKKNLFGEVINSKMILNDYGKIVDDEWLKTKELRKNIDLDEYVIMPNHFHGILIIERGDTARCVPTTSVNENRKFGEMQSGSLSAIIRAFKSVVTKKINELRSASGKEVWQKGFYEHIIRNENDLYNIRKYIELNPLKWEIDEYYLNEKL
jgi:REP element-mobilizing transposase RayT